MTRHRWGRVVAFVGSVSVFLIGLAGLGPGAPPASATAPQGAIAAGRYHTCALSAGHAYCWGLNASGELGDGMTTVGFNNVPIEVKGLFGSGHLSTVTALCGPGVAGTLEWWSGTSWLPVVGDPEWATPSCTGVTLGETSSPSLATIARLSRLSRFHGVVFAARRRPSQVLAERTRSRDATIVGWPTFLHATSATMSARCSAESSTANGCG